MVFLSGPFHHARTPAARRRSPPPRDVRPALESLEGRLVPSSLAGYVYCDANNNAVMDPGENRLAGVTVTLSGTDASNHNVNLTQKTDANGFYSFTNLAAGTYALRASPPSGFLAGQASAGSLGGTAGGSSLSNIALGAGASGTGYALGELAAADGWTAIQSNFNGTAVPAGSTLWFSSVLKASGLGTGPVTLRFTGQSLTFSANGTAMRLSVPDTVLTYSPAAASAVTTFDASANAWDTTLPMSYSGNGFLGGLAFPAPYGLPGGLNPVTWQGQLVSDMAGVSVNWQWAAAVYTQFSTDNNALQVKPVDDPQASAYKNSDHAGTPEAFRAYVTGGARGGGGSNFTGSYSATASVMPPLGPVNPPSPASLSGSVSLAGGGGLSGVLVTLTGTNAQGQTVNLATYTADDGSFTFSGLQPGTYSLTETPPGGYVNSSTSVGTVNGASDGTVSAQGTVSQISLGSGNNAFDYNFGVYFPS